VKKRTLITGGAGFIGSHLCDYLLKKEHQVICMDSLITGSTDNITHLAGNEDFKFVKHDVTNYIYIEGKLDYIMHFASPASPIDYMMLPIQTLKVGSIGTHKALGLAKNKGATILLASTSEVYGDPLIHPQMEEYWGNVNPVGPRGVYDEAKRFAEALTMAYHRYHGVHTRIARIFNTYGPRMRLDDGRALPTFMCQVLEGKDVTIFGDGNQTRSFCYIDDQVRGLYSLLTSEENEPINMGNPDEITINELAERIIKETGSKSKLINKALPVDDPKVRQPDITKAINKLGWTPKVKLEDGLRLTIKDFETRLNKKNESS